LENTAISATNGLTSYRLGPEEASRQFLSTLQGAVGRRVKVMRANHSINNSQSEMIAKVDSAGSHVGASMKSCRIGVLFSGGIDSVLLAAVLHLCLHPEEPIDLMNVSFQDDSLGEAATSAPAPAPDRLAAIAAVAELKVCYKRRHHRQSYIITHTALYF
jgi:asparagine synthetase B (glutamine-hydrolysing)